MNPEKPRAQTPRSPLPGAGATRELPKAYRREKGGPAATGGMPRAKPAAAGERVSPPETREATGGAPALGGETVHQRIALVAYHLYEQRGCQPGHDIDDWLEAERRVLGAAHASDE
jgi:hypothetical protein